MLVYRILYRSFSASAYFATRPQTFFLLPMFFSNFSQKLSFLCHLLNLYVFPSLSIDFGNLVNAVWFNQLRPPLLCRPSYAVWISYLQDSTNALQRISPTLQLHKIQPTHSQLPTTQPVLFAALATQLTYSTSFKIFSFLVTKLLRF